MSSDRELIQRSQRGDHIAFDGIVRRYQDGLFRHLLALTSDSEQAEDVCQEAFIRFYEFLPRIHTTGSIAPLLFKIATNLWRDRLRAARADCLTVALDELSAGIRVDDEALNRLERQAVTNAISQLRQEFQEVLSLRYDQGLSYQEIAEITGVPTNTVASWLHRALGALRVILQGEGSKEVLP